MSTDPFGPETPGGDGLPPKDSAAPEDFLGLGSGDSTPTEEEGEVLDLDALDFGIDEQDALTLRPPSVEAGPDPTDELEELVSRGPQELQPLVSRVDVRDGELDLDDDGELGLASAGESEDGLEADPVPQEPDPAGAEVEQPLGLLDDLMEPGEELESRVPTAEELIARVEPEAAALESLEETFERADTFNLELDDEFGGELGEELEIDEHSWLMEFEFEEDEEFAEPVTLVSRDPEAVALVEEGLAEEEVGVPEFAPYVSSRKKWTKRAVLAVLSVVGGAVGAKFLDLYQTTPDPAPQVAQRQPELPVRPGPSADQADPRPSDTDSEPTTVAVGDGGPVVTEPTPTEEAPSEPEAPVVAEGPTPVVDVQAPEGTPEVEGRSMELSVEDMVLLAEEHEGHVREATPKELSGIWLGATVPLRAIAGQTRMLTPNVGGVRILLQGGEVFEGELYAVGEKKVWIETGLGRMALLEWQIDRIDHVVSGDGPVAADPDLAGLKSVRVRTAGGVFYGKLLSREGNDVTLMTPSGARVTLEGAEVEVAGRSTTRLIDASGALEEEPAKSAGGGQ